jgi:hypothetical protein
VVAIDLWADLGAPLILAVAATAIAAVWPWYQALRRRERLTALMRRELEEIGPREPLRGKEWWEHLKKRFVHEESFRQCNVVENRDFLLSLHSSLVYHASQLGIAFDKHDLTQGRWHLRQLLHDKDIAGHVRSTRAWRRWRNGSAFPARSRSVLSVIRRRASRRWSAPRREIVREKRTPTTTTQKPDAGVSNATSVLC